MSKVKINHFKKSVNEFQEYFGLWNWEISIDVLDKGNKNRGECSWNWTGGVATISYGKEWIARKNVSMDEVRKTAFHECAELFLCSTTIDLEKHYSWDYAQKASHEVIRFLENKLYPKI